MKKWFIIAVLLFRFGMPFTGDAASLTVTIDRIEVNSGIATIHYTNVDPQEKPLATTNWAYSTDDGQTWTSIDGTAIGNNDPKPPGSSTLSWDMTLGINPLGETSLVRFRMQVYDPDDIGSWQAVAPMSTERTSPGIAVVDGNLYVAGGYRYDGRSEAHLSTVEAYDPTQNVWQAMASMPTPRVGLGMSVVNGKIYAIGGNIGSRAFLSTVEVYEPVTNIWSPVASMPTVRSGLVTAVVNGKVYAIGGRPDAGGTGLAAVEVYHPATDVWRAVTSMPTARFSLTATALNGKVYVIGGSTGRITDGSRRDYSTVEAYDPLNDSWQTVTSMPAARRAMAATTVNGKIYVIGGESGEDLGVVEEYDPQLDRWRTMAPMPTARRGVAAAAMDGKIYAVGGGAAGVKTVELFTPPRHSEMTQSIIDADREQRPDTYQVNIALDKGINLLSLPLRPETTITASQLAADLGATVIIRAVQGKFQAYIPDGNFGIDFPLEVGKGYIVNLLQATTYRVTGQPWGTPIDAAPVLPDGGTWAFVVAGFLPDGRETAITARHLNRTVEGYAANGRFILPFVDMSRQDTIRPGDLIEIEVDRETIIPHQVSLDDITHAYAVVHVPRRFVLYQNYPNPFNPETWLPYQLADDAEVTIGIYDISGRLLRQLVLGQKPAGLYLSRDRAAYWDGRSESGELVSSGVYFYQLKTGDYSATRRMVILK